MTHKLNTKLAIIWLDAGKNRNKSHTLASQTTRSKRVCTQRHYSGHHDTWPSEGEEWGWWRKAIVDEKQEMSRWKWRLKWKSLRPNGSLRVVCEFYWWWCDDVESSATKGPTLTSGNKNSKKEKYLSSHASVLRNHKHTFYDPRSIHVGMNEHRTSNGIQYERSLLWMLTHALFSVAELKFKTIGIDHKNSHTHTHTDIHSIRGHIRSDDELAHHKYGFY